MHLQYHKPSFVTFCIGEKYIYFDLTTLKLQIMKLLPT